MLTLRFSSTLAATPERVWRQVITPRGINRETMPLCRMTFPDGMQDLDQASVKVGEPICTSWFLLFGVLPIDRARVTLVAVGPGYHFLEESPLGSMRLWRHDRSVAETPGGCRLVDELTFEPKLALMRPLARWFIGTMFRHRHAVLRRDFGALPGRAE